MRGEERGSGPEEKDKDREAMNPLSALSSLPAAAQGEMAIVSVKYPVKCWDLQRITSR